MKHYNIINALEVNCPFTSILKDFEDPSAPAPRRRRELAYIRADYDGCRWWNTVWPIHDELAVPEMRREVDGLYELLISEDAFSDLNRLRGFCECFPQARTRSDDPDAYDFYLEGEFCWYWLHCITRSKDYNLYLHAFAKEPDPVMQPYFAYLDKNPALKEAELIRSFPKLTEDQAFAIRWRWQKRFKLPTENKEDAP